MTVNNYSELRNAYIRRFRRCKSLDTLEKVYESMRDRNHIAPENLLAFESAADHRRAELATGKLWDKVPPHVWQYVR
nr:MULTISPECIES: Hha/YmoA family nucleoid-associated regulatory protein [Rosenbergiella]